MIKHIFCDLDGTLYKDSKISDKDLAAINLASISGINFSIATGRVFSHSEIIIDEIDAVKYLICENGSYIFDKDHACIFKGVLSDNQIKRIIDLYNSLDYIDKENDIIYFKYDGEVVIPTCGESVEYFAEGTKVEPSILERETYNSKVGNIGVVTNDAEKMKRIVTDYRTHFGIEFEVYISSESTINIVPRGISKFDAIKAVCKREGISLDEVVTIGDSPNDISMLKNIDMSFAMENARDVVKSVAKYETPTVGDAIKMVVDFNELSV